MGVVHESRMYVATGTRLYRSGLLSAASWSALSLIATFPQAISDITPFKDDLMILPGGAAMKRYNAGPNTVTDPWVAGEGGVVGQGYKGQLVFSSGVAQERYQVRIPYLNANGLLRISLHAVDAPVVRMGVHGGKVAVATRQSLYLFDGEETVTGWTGSMEPLFSHGIWTADDDFQWLLSFGGKLYTWLAGRVVVYDPGVAGGSWSESGPRGQAVYGAAVAGGFLCVAVLEESGDSALWATDGAGWFRLDRRAAGGEVLMWPCVTGGCGKTDLLVFKSGLGEYELYRLVPRAGGLRTYASDGEWVTALLDAGDPANIKGWTEVGAIFATPEVRGNAGSTDAVTVTLDYCLDAGASWIEVDSQSPASASTRLIVLTAPLAGISSRHLQLRVRWSGVVDWAPVLSELWAEWVVDDRAAPRRRWEIVTATRDRQIRRDGSVDPLSGRQQIAALWNAWEAGETVLLRDIDYDAAPVEREVRIVGIGEETAKPGDAGRWGQGPVRLSLVEV